MALRSTMGKLRGLGFRRPKWGVRGSLFAAFAVIAGMAIVISAGAGMVLGHLGGSMLDLSGRDIPRLAASLQLAAQSASLASQGPALLASGSEEALNERARKMKETQHDAVDKLGQITELGADKTVVAALGETVKSIDDTIKSLGAAATERLRIAAQREKQYDALRKAQTAFAAAAGPAMMAALSATNGDALEQVEKAFKAAYPNIKSNLDSLTKNNDTAALKDAALKLLAFGDGKTSVFKTRQKELDADDYGQLILDETRKLNVGLGISVKQLVD